MHSVKLTFDTTPEWTFSESDDGKRTISGLAIPAGEKGEPGDGKLWTFAAGSVKFGDRTPLMSYHDVARPVGKLINSEWTDRGLQVSFHVSATPAGDEALTLAADGVLGLSVGVNIPDGGYSVKGRDLTVHEAFASEVSLVSVPAFAGATIDKVSFSKEEPTMAEPEGAVDVAALNQTLSTLNVTLSNIAQGPSPTVTPNLTVNEPAPYRFDGGKADHCFMRDLREGYLEGIRDSKTRVDNFIHQTFAVSQANVDTLKRPGFHPELYVDELPAKTPLTPMISGGPAPTDLTPFYVPKFATAGTLVAPHVEGVEPALGTFTTTTMLIEPEALSGKIEINREVVDKVGPQADALIWAKMVRAYTLAGEARIATMLEAHTTGPATLAFNGVDAALADDVDTTLLGVTDLERYSILAASSALFTALATARDDNGRKLFPNVSPSNADGTRSALDTLDMNGIRVVRAASLTNSWLIEKGAVYQWMSAPQKLNFDIQVKSVYLGLFGYSAEAIIDDAGVRKVTYATT